jgi:hypothetical protein
MKSVLIVGSAPDALRIQSVDCSKFLMWLPLTMLGA